MNLPCRIPQRAACKATLAAGASVVSSIGAAMGGIPSPSNDILGTYSTYEFPCAFESCSVLNGKSIAMNALLGLPGKYGRADWDAYGAEPLSDMAWKCACSFVLSMPATIEAADVGVDADGDVTFEWFHSRESQCLLTFSASGKVYCNVKSGDNRIAAVLRADETDKIMKIACEVVNV